MGLLTKFCLDTLRKPDLQQEFEVAKAEEEAKVLWFSKPTPNNQKDDNAEIFQDEHPEAFSDSAEDNILDGDLVSEFWPRLHVECWAVD